MKKDIPAWRNKSMAELRYLIEDKTDLNRNNICGMIHEIQ